jgi:hypothetical protein
MGQKVISFSTVLTVALALLLVPTMMVTKAVENKVH